MSLQCYNRAHRGYYTFKKRESPCRSEQKPDAFVCSARGHASVNKPIRLPCVYVCTLRATYFCRTRWSRRFFRRIFPFRSSNTSLSLPRLLSSSRLYPTTTRCFLLLFFFYSPILLFLILYSQLRARRVDGLRACVNTHIICDRNMHFKLVFFDPNYDRSKLRRHGELCCRKLVFVALKGCFRLVGKGRENFTSFERR